MAKLRDPNNLFDFINILFTDKKHYSKLRDYEKSRHFFMTSRFMAISFPVQANYLQHLKVNTAGVLDYWQETMTRLYSRVPSWIYIKTKQAKKDIKNKHVDDSVIEEYCKRMGYNRRQVNESIEFFGDKMIDELKQFEKLMKQ